MSKKEVIEGICKVCGGSIVKLFKDKEITKSHGYGPGFKTQVRKVNEGFYCKKCGIKYQFVPK